MSIVYSDRSTVTRHQECPRSRWFQHEVPTEEGFGVVPKAADPNLLVGTVFHEGVCGLLNGDGIEEAYGTARELHLKVLKDNGLAADCGDAGSGAMDYLVAENLAIGEALIRGYEKVVLPQVLERFEVLSTEQEEVTRFAIDAVPEFEIAFASRTDGILLEKCGENLFVLSLKTKKEWKAGDEDKNRYDTQGLTEWNAVESRLAGYQEVMDLPDDSFANAFSKAGVPKWFQKRHALGHSPTVMGVTMQFALKGRGEKKDGIWKHTSPLIRPWMKSSASGREWAWSYEFQDALGGNHRLGKGWNRVNIWEAWNVRDWIEYLWEENVQERGPGSAIENAFVLPADYYRNEEDRERRIRQIVFQEARVQVGREKLSAIQSGRLISLNGSTLLQDIEAELDNTFPMHSDYPVNCGYCPFEVCCYGPKQYLLNPLASGLFEPRTSNHAIEVEIRGKGKLRT